MHGAVTKKERKKQTSTATYEKPRNKYVQLTIERDKYDTPSMTPSIVRGVVWKISKERERERVSYEDGANI